MFRNSLISGLDAWNQVVECRRILKYSFAYGFYYFEDESDLQRLENKEFFEFLQVSFRRIDLDRNWDVLKGETQASLERLHGMVEQQLKAFLDSAKNEFPTNLEKAQELTSEFIEIRKNLLSLTDVTQSYFEKFVRQLEAGFDSIQQTYTAGSFQNPVFRFKSYL